jgi:hypothetical protein
MSFFLGHQTTKAFFGAFLFHPQKKTKIGVGYVFT